MLQLQGTLDTEDAFRTKHADRSEYTHSATSHGRARRIDQIHVSSAVTLPGAMPQLMACKHVHHADPSLARQHKPATTGASEDRHSAVSIDMSFSEKDAPPQRWRFDNARLLHAGAREALQAIIQACTAEGGTATAKIQRIAVRVKHAETAAKTRARRENTQQKAKIAKTVQVLRNNLGLGLQGRAAIPAWMSIPGRREQQQRRLRTAEAELAVLLANEHRHATDGDDHDEYLEDLPTKRNYAARRQAEQGAHTPIESIKETDGSTTSTQSGLLESARTFFRERFNRAYERDAAMRNARDTCLAAITRTLPKALAAEFSLEKLLTE